MPLLMRAFLDISFLARSHSFVVLLGNGLKESVIFFIGWCAASIFGGFAYRLYVVLMWPWKELFRRYMPGLTLLVSSCLLVGTEFTFDAMTEGPAEARRFLEEVWGGFYRKVQHDRDLLWIADVPGLLFYSPPARGLAIFRNVAIIVVLFILGAGGCVILAIFCVLFVNRHRLSATTLSRQKTLTVVLLVQALVPLCCACLPLLLVAITTFLYDEATSLSPLHKKLFSSLPTRLNDVVNTRPL